MQVTINGQNFGTSGQIVWFPDKRIVKVNEKTVRFNDLRPNIKKALLAAKR